MSGLETIDVRLATCTGCVESKPCVCFLGKDRPTIMLYLCAGCLAKMSVKLVEAAENPNFLALLRAEKRLVEKSGEAISKALGLPYRTPEEEFERAKLSMGVLRKDIVYCGRLMTLACDGRCHKAWGNNNRPQVSCGEDVDDFEFLSDNETELAPADPGTSEGADSKPREESEQLNKWCARECERSVLVPLGAPISLPNFKERISNRKGA